LVPCDRPCPSLADALQDRCTLERELGPVALKKYLVTLFAHIA
jgi:hypothetical protein